MLSKLDDICNNFDKIILRGSEYYIPYDLFEKILKLLFEENIFVLGIETYILQNSSLFPVLEFIADFSHLSKKPNRVKLAYDESQYFYTLIKTKENVYFNICIDE